jgi:hypothetical protein
MICETTGWRLPPEKPATPLEYCDVTGYRISPKDHANGPD